MNKKIVTLILLSFLSFFSPSSFAEGNCPPGQYPIGGQGAVACAPIPQDGNLTQQPARPLRKWIKTWGAIAMGWMGPVPYYAVPTGMLSETEAETEALARCSKKGPKDCAIKLTYFNQCAAIAEPQTAENLIPDGSVTIFTGNASIDGASSKAKEECKNRNKDFPVTCKVIYKNCSKQIFQKF